MSNRIPAMDGVRVLAVWGIALYHLNMYYPVSPLLGSLGGKGVILCFLLSGFLTGYLDAGKENPPPLRFGDGLRFTLRKLAKFYPAHLIACLIALWLEMVPAYLKTGVWQLSKPMQRAFAAHLFLVQSYIPSEQVLKAYNSVSWFLSTSMFLYLCTPLLLSLFRRVRSAHDRLLYLMMFYLPIPMLTIALRHSANLTQLLYNSPLLRIFEYSIGILAGMMFRKDPDFRFGSMTKDRYFWLLLLDGAVFNIISIILEPQYSYISNLTCLYTLFLFWIAKSRRLCPALLGNALFRFLARFSFEVFIFHQVVMRTFRLVMGYTLTMEQSFWCCVGLIFAVSLIAHAILWPVRWLLRPRRKTPPPPPPPVYTAPDAMTELDLTTFYK